MAAPIAIPRPTRRGSYPSDDVSLAVRIVSVVLCAPFVVFALLDTFGKGWPTIICLVLAGLGLVLLPVILITTRKLDAQKVDVVTAQIRDGDILAYIATYIVPFAAMAGTTARERGAIGLFFLLIGLLYVRSELFYINPFLALVGYRLFQIVTPANATVVLLHAATFSCIWNVP